MHKAKYDPVWITHEYTIKKEKQIHCDLERKEITIRSVL